MQYFKGKTPNGPIFLTFDPGDQLLEGIHEVLRQEGIDFGVVLCGVGTLSQAHIQYAANSAGERPQPKYVKFEGAIEVGSLQGPIIDGQAHVHMTLFNYFNQQVYIGHLEADNKVLNRMEVVVQPGGDLRLIRVVDPNTGEFHIREREG